MSETALLFTKLLHCLKKQEEVMDSLIALSDAQFEALRENDITKLNETVLEQEKGAEQMNNIEKQRLYIIDSLEKELKTARGLPLKELLEYAGDKEKIPLQELLKSMQAKMEKLAENNFFNSLVIRNSLMVNSMILNMFTAEGSPNTYGQRGEAGGANRRASVLNESV